MWDVCQSIVTECHGNIDYQEFEIELIRYLSLACPISEEQYLKMNTEQIVEALYAQLLEMFDRKQKTITEQA